MLPTHSDRVAQLAHMPKHFLASRFADIFFIMVLYGENVFFFHCNTASGHFEKLAARLSCFQGAQSMLTVDIIEGNKCNFRILTIYTH